MNKTHLWKKLTKKAEEKVKTTCFRFFIQECMFFYAIKPDDCKANTLR